MVWWNWEEIIKRPGVAWLIAHPAQQQPPVILVDKENLLKNGGFEDDLNFWGTGYYETDVYHGSLGVFWASRVGTSIDAMNVADVRGDIDSDNHKSGSKSFKITNNSPLEAHIYGSMSQRVTGLLKNTDYIASFWVKAERASRGTLEITTDLKWSKRKLIEPGTYDWKEFSQVFNTDNNTFVDFRIISEEPGTVWIDDIVFRRYFLP
jgi:Carbohydrate binding domain